MTPEDRTRHIDRALDSLRRAADQLANVDVSDAAAGYVVMQLERCIDACTRLSNDVDPDLIDLGAREVKGPFHFRWVSWDELPLPRR